MTGELAKTMNGYRSINMSIIAIPTVNTLIPSYFLSETYTCIPRTVWYPVINYTVESCLFNFVSTTLLHVYSIIVADLFVSLATSSYTLWTPISNLVQPYVNI